MKKCIKCCELKEINLFYKDRRRKDGHRNKCISCTREENKNWSSVNKDKVNLSNKKWRDNNKEKLKEVYKMNNKKRKDYLINWRDNNKEYMKEYYENNKDEIKEKRKEYAKKWRDNNKEYMKEYYENNKDEIKEKRKDYLDMYRVTYNEIRRSRRKTDNLYKLYCNISNYIRKSLKGKGYSKSSKSIDYIGCSIGDFKLHLESKFEPWMNWENHGLYNGDPNYGWDIDHIIPLSSASNEDELVKLFDYKNTQPLCSKINRDIKYNKINYGDKDYTNI